jgi:hypothetical protein
MDIIHFHLVSQKEPPRREAPFESGELDKAEHITVSTH